MVPNLLFLHYLIKISLAVSGYLRLTKNMVSVDQNKARLVVKGFNQQGSINYGNTFSSIIKP